MNKHPWILVAALVLIATFARAQTVEYIHTDALGSPVAVTNASGAVIERTVYEPYGAVINRPLKNEPGYTSHVADAVTGLNYMQQRYFDPEIGRFLSSDPVAANSGAGENFNRYWYANNNPYGYTDPDGRQVEGVYYPDEHCIRSQSCFDEGQAESSVTTVTVTAGSSDDVSSIRLGFDYFLGIGPAYRYFGPETEQARDMADSIPVRNAIAYYMDEHAAEIFSPGGIYRQDFTGLNVTNYRGIVGFWEGVFRGFQATEQFVGSASVDIVGGPERSVTILLNNTSGLTSLTGDQFGLKGFERKANELTPFGNIRQTIMINLRIP